MNDWEGFEEYAKYNFNKNKFLTLLMYLIWYEQYYNFNFNSC